MLLATIFPSIIQCSTPGNFATKWRLATLEFVIPEKPVSVRVEGRYVAKSFLARDSTSVQSNNLAAIFLAPTKLQQCGKGRLACETIMHMHMRMRAHF